MFHYASVFSPKLSLLLLERNSVTLQRMFIDSLEVKDNLRMYKKFSDQDSDDKMEKELELNEQCEQEELAFPSNPGLYGQEKDQINVMQGRDYNPLFYESCSQPVINPVGDNFEEVFILSVFDEYEDDYLDSSPKKPIVDFVSLGPDKEGNEGSKIKVSPYFSNSEVSRWGKCFVCLILLEKMVVSLLKHVERMKL